jgi:4-amino-4-deoxy-L-arabinose transferase-like glycosyltransferase
MLTPDMVLTFWITAAITAFVLWTCHSERRHWLWLSFAAMGAGFFTKGPMAIVVPVSAVAAWQIAHKRRGKPAKIPWLRGMMLTFVLGLSWFVVVAIKEPGLFHFFAHDELLARFFTKQHGRYHSPLFFIPVILGGLLPWTFLLPALVRWLVNEGKTQRGLPPAWWLLIGWVVPPFLVLSLSGSKLITYVLPLYPALALALGAWWDQNGSRRSLTWPAVGVVGLFAGLTVALVAATRFAPHLVPEVPLLVMGTLSLVVLAMGAMVVPPTPQPSLLGGGFVGGAMAIWLLLLSQASSWNDVMGTGASMRSLAQRIGNHRGSMPTVFVYGVNVPGLEWYLRQLVYISKDRADDLLPMTAVQQARLVSSPQQCADLPALGRPVFGVVKLSKVGSDWPTNTWRLVATAGRFALIQRIEVDSQPPPKP